MNTMFTRGPSLVSRLALALFVSVILIFVDHKYDGFASVKVYLNSIVSPLQYIASLPGQMLSSGAEKFSTHKKLLEDNQQLTLQAMKMSEKLQRFDLLAAENDRLRALLGAPVSAPIQKMVTELMAVDNNPFSLQIIIDKGAINGVYEGQTVLDDKGIVGQIMEVGTTNSRVLLLADITHAIPLRNARNNVQLIASGSGQFDELILEHVAHSADIQVGDLLVSSGLGNIFPEGYPTATITSIVRDESRPFALVTATPIAQLDRLRYLLLLWPADAPTQPIMPQSTPTVEAQ
ncbi:rod shape-determining protein MreC [Aliiglaciecola sp. 2_MG-2023]|uniref:rod shape-determining protein MreC n=1 Tax=Alteromonadaceae TaxID=72275 RepID=UPI0026E29F31|nr:MULTISPECIES: rod shape-determining protein MreC [unclassified Aliiglaciecola]MDO6713258.1 rod shape-determining protein MreC [Aliiglaciecola sp. 2_MG-2023]MDO6754350.1 rod shape-determining protein MreC [Aliiglaciecola sp. 1_MG-2023]